MERLLPRIPEPHNERFRATLESISLTYLVFASVMLWTCFLVESFLFREAGRAEMAISSICLSLLMLGLSAALIAGWWRPRRSGLWCLGFALAPYTMIMLGTMDPGYNPCFHLAVAMIGLCFFLPFVRLCILGAGIFGVTLVLFLFRESGGEWMPTLSFAIPSLMLSVFGFLGQQNGIRRSFLKQLEIEEVNRELHLSKLALDHSTHYVVWLDRHGQFQYGNDAFCKAVGYTSQDLRTLQIAELSPELSGREWRVLVGELLDRGSALRQLHLHTQDKETRRVEMQFDLVDSPHRQIICGVATDLTERQRLDEEIRRVQRLEGLDTLASGLAHDYNNLLVPIVTNASLALDELEDDHALRPAISDIISAGERAASLTEQLLAYTGVSGVEPIPLSVSNELNAVAKILRSSLPKGTRLVIDNETGEPLILGEPAQIHQVLLNLVLNAGQAVQPLNGIIKIHTGCCQLSAIEASRLSPPTDRPAGAYVTCEIIDNGSGMTSDVQSRMFSPFFTTKKHGHGLGLSAVLGIMRNHRGGILVDSLPGTGTTITLFIPAYFGKAGRRGEPMKREANETVENRVVLFVDDEPLIRNVGQLVLTTKGYEVLLAESGTEAIELFEQHADSVDVVVLDNRMPGPCMTETVTALRKRRPDVRIIASSGYPSEIPADFKTGPGRIDILPKPYQANELADAVSGALAKNRDAPCTDELDSTSKNITV